MKLLFLTSTCIGLYILILWLSTRYREDKISSLKWVLQATLGTLCVLWPILFINQFWVLFLAALVIVFALFVGAQGGVFGRLSKNGIFGGIWLTIPLYFYLVTNT